MKQESSSKMGKIGWKKNQKKISSIFRGDEMERFVRFYYGDLSDVWSVRWYDSNLSIAHFLFEYFCSLNPMECLKKQYTQLFLSTLQSLIHNHIFILGHEKFKKYVCAFDMAFLFYLTPSYLVMTNKKSSHINKHGRTYQMLSEEFRSDVLFSPNFAFKRT